MFGNMFDEAEGPVQGCAPNPTVKVNGSKFEAPPPLRAETGFCGIKNQGATCYLNSLIQTLLLTPEFREELFRLGPDELGKLEDMKIKSAKVRIIPIQLQMLLARLLLLDQYACGTENLTESFGWVDNEELQQHDVQELSRILFCAIEDSLVGTSGHAIIKNLYRGVIANTIACLNCGKVSERPEEFLDLNIAIAALSSLTAVLKDMFVETELMNGKNQYHCDNCAKLVDARKGAVIKTLPPILTVSLLRFSFDYSTLRRFKETRKFEFPLTLNMRDFCGKAKGVQSSGCECYEYDLYSVIIHSGSAHGGHYHAYIRDVDGLGTTPPGYDPTPPKITLPDPPKLNTGPDHVEDPLEMVAAVLGKLGGENVPLNKLGEAFREESGTSWSKQYKRKYGTMIKFLQSCYDTFMVDTRAKTVSFRSKMSASSNHKYFENSPITKHEAALINSSYSSGDAFPDLDAIQTPSTVNGSSDLEKSYGDCQSPFAEDRTAYDEAQCDLDNDFHPMCNVWFDFNDSHVKTITTHDIETQFEGRESAYMLFYRRRDLRRPLLSLGNARNGIPDHIIAKIQEENCNLEHLRNEYDVYLNVVTVEVFFPSMFKYDKGLIKLIEEEPSASGFSYSIDRRKTMADMIVDLLQMAEKHDEHDLVKYKEDLQCNILKVLEHGGIHLFERVDQDRNVLVCDSLLENGQKLLLWKGKELAGTKVSPGNENEPKVINIHCEIEGEAEVSCFDYKGVTSGNMPVENLQQYFLDKLKTEDIVSSKIQLINENGNLDEIGKDQCNKPICDFVKSCQGNLMLQVALGSKDADSRNENDDLTLNVSLTSNLEEKVLSCIGNDANKVFTLTSVNCKVKVSSFIFVEHLKSKVPRWLFPQVQSKFSLHNLNLCVENTDTLGLLKLPKLSLHEQQSLSNAGLLTNTSIKLDIGPPLDKNSIHVLVYVQKGTKLKLPVKKCQSAEIVCDSTQSVTNLIEKIVTDLDLPEGPHHVRMLKSEKEAGDIITDPDQAVEKTPIHHGCVFMLCTGNVPSEGRLCVPVWFYPTMRDFNELCKIIEDNPESSPWKNVLNEEDIKPVVVGCIEINKDATIFDFKSEIVKMDYIISKSLPKVESICLRSISHKLPTRFHLQDSALIKRLRLGPSNPVAVQSSTCNPQDNYTALHLSFNIPGTRVYTNDCELRWEKSSNFAQFPAKLADIFEVPAKEILIAKRGEEPWDWEIIKTRDSEAKAKENKSSVKGKKGSKQKNKPKNKKTSGKLPTLPQDGDVIRVKRLIPGLEGAPEVTDFKSDEDVALHKRWQDSRLKESNSQPKEDSQCEKSGKKSKSKKEETLRIHVDKF